VIEKQVIAAISWIGGFALSQRGNSLGQLKVVREACDVAAELISLVTSPQLDQPLVVNGIKVLLVTG